MKPFLFPLKTNLTNPIFENKNKLYNIIISDKDLEKVLKEDIYYEGTILEKMEKLRGLPKDSSDYEKLYQDIIKVGEYPI